MLKALRKYRGPLLAVGGSLLMIAFLVPEVVKQLQGDPGKIKIAEVSGRKVSAREIGVSEREFSALKFFYEPLVGDMLQVQDGVHWYLLSKEAEQAGLVGQPTNGLQWLPEFSRETFQYEYSAALQRQDFQRLMAMQSVLKDAETAKAYYESRAGEFAKRREAAAGQSQLTLDQFDLALAKAKAVLGMRANFLRAARVSDVAARSIVKRQADQATVDLVAIPSERMADQVGEPSENELADHFKQYQNSKPGTGLFGFGYVLPPRFKLEWLKIDRNAIAAAIQLDPIEVSKLFSKNRDKYKGEFAVEKPNVEKDLRDQKVGEVMADADRIVRAEVARSLRKLETDGTYKKLPADWDAQRPKFEAIAPAIVDAIKSTQKITIPLPQVVMKAADWLTAEDIAALPDLGPAQVRLGNRAIALPGLILQTREIAGASDIGLQVGVPFIESPITDSVRNRYYLTVLDAKAEAPAANLDEVRAAVIRDVKAQKAYLNLMGQNNSHLTLAATGGVRSVAELYNTQASSKFKDSPLIPQSNVAVSEGGQLPAAVDAKEFRDAVLKAATELDPLKPAAEQDAIKRTIVVGIPSKHTAVVAQIVALKPVTIESYRNIVENQITDLQRREIQTLVRDNPTKYVDPFSADSLKARFAYKDIRPSTEAANRKKSKGS